MTFRLTSGALRRMRPIAGIAAIAVVAVGCSGRNWSLDDPWGVHQAVLTVDRANQQQAQEDQEKFDKAFHDSLCSTPEGRRTVAEQIARSPPGEVEPCSEDEAH